MAMTGSTSTICTMPATSMTMTPRAIGSGAKTFHVASTSALALDSSWPEGCRWCHDSGSRRYCRVTSRRKPAATLYMVKPAATRRMTTPTTLTDDDARRPSRRSSTAAARSTVPASTAGWISSRVTLPIAHAVSTVITP